MLLGSPRIHPTVGECSPEKYCCLLGFLQLPGPGCQTLVRPMILGSGQGQNRSFIVIQYSSPAFSGILPPNRFKQAGFKPRKHHIQGKRSDYNDNPGNYARKPLKQAGHVWIRIWCFWQSGLKICPDWF